MRKFYTFLLKLLGWKSSVTVDVPLKCVLCVAPHTSNLDFFIGMIFYRSLGRFPNFLMKKNLFFFPLKYLLKALGGFPVNRKKKSYISGQMLNEFNKRERFQLAIAPEGTRKKNGNWKSGFYYIALHAGVPITLAYIDYSKKEVGIFKNVYPTGNSYKDIEEIKQYYKHIKGKHPRQFSI